MSVQADGSGGSHPAGEAPHGFASDQGADAIGKRGAYQASEQGIGKTKEWSKGHRSSDDQARDRGYNQSPHA